MELLDDDEAEEDDDESDEDDDDESDDVELDEGVSLFESLLAAELPVVAPDDELLDPPRLSVL